MSKPEVDIDDWYILGNTLYGRAQNHPRFDKGTEVRTSTIVSKVNHPKAGDVIETRNTLYRLGKPYENETQQDNQELRERVGKVLSELLGLPLRKDTGYTPMENDPYGRIQLQNINNQSKETVQELSGESYETISRQYKRIPETITAIVNLVLEEKDKPAHIMGKSIDEVIQILSGLELERIEDLQMTMSNLGEWMERVREDHHKAVQKALDKSFEDISAQLKKGKE